MEQTEKPSGKIVTPYSAITADHILSWKAAYGEHVLSEINVAIPMEPVGPDAPLVEPLVAKFVVKSADRPVMDAVAQYGSQKNITASNKVLINNCVLGGDMDLLQRFGYCYTAVLREIVKLNNQAEVTVKKL